VVEEAKDKESVVAAVVAEEDQHLELLLQDMASPFVPIGNLCPYLIVLVVKRNTSSGGTRTVPIFVA
jgi:hypothetical protein